MFIEMLKTLRLYKRETFMRPRSQVDPNRASNNYKHVCSTCDTKKYAQKIGVKMRKVYKIDASSTQTL